MGSNAIFGVAAYVGTYIVSQAEQAKKEAKQNRDEANAKQAKYESDYKEKTAQEKIQSEMFQRRNRQKTSAVQAGGRGSTILSNKVGPAGAAPVGDVVPPAAGSKTLLGT